MGNISHIFPTVLGLDQELENVGILLESSNAEGLNTIGYPNYFPTFQQHAQSKTTFFFIMKFLIINFFRHKRRNNTSIGNL